MRTPEVDPAAPAVAGDAAAACAAAEEATDAGVNPLPERAQIDARIAARVPGDAPTRGRSSRPRIAGRGRATRGGGRGRGVGNNSRRRGTLATVSRAGYDVPDAADPADDDAEDDGVAPSEAVGGEGSGGGGTSEGADLDLPLLASSFDERVHGCAAEVLACVCRHARLHELGAVGEVGVGTGEPALRELPATAFEVCGLLGRLLLSAEPSLVQPAVEALGRCAWHAENEAPLRLLLEDEPALAGVLAAAIGDDDTVAAAGGAVAPPPPAPTAATGENATVAAAELQKEAALDVLHVLARGPMSARIALGREPSLVPRLCALLIPPAAAALSRRAVDILASLAAAPGNRAAFRSHEVYIARLAMQQPDGNLPITAAFQQLHELLLELCA